MAGLASLEITGDVQAFQKFTRRQLLDKNLQRHIRRGTIKASLFLIREVKRSIREKEYEENSPLTLLTSRGTIPLLKEKNLVDAIAHQLKDSFRSEVGIIKNAQSTGSRFGEKPGASTIEMKKLVELMETGYTIRITQKMIAALIATLESQKTKRGKVKKRQQETLDKIGENSGRRGGTWRVPPRRVFTSVWERRDIREGVIQIWREALEDMWKAQGAKGGEHKDR